MSKRYHHRNCQSLFGYAQHVHERSGGVCQLCGAGAGEEISFDLWRQLTVEHLIGESQGGYLPKIRKAVQRRFPSLSADQREHLARAIDEANTVTACSFCNATTSRNRNAVSMDELIQRAKGEPSRALDEIRGSLKEVFEKKRRDVQWKLDAVREAFEREVRPVLQQVREESSGSSNNSLQRTLLARRR